MTYLLPIYQMKKANDNYSEKQWNQIMHWRGQPIMKCDLKGNLKSVLHLLICKVNLIHVLWPVFKPRKHGFLTNCQLTVVNWFKYANVKVNAATTKTKKCAGRRKDRSQLWVKNHFAEICSWAKIQNSNKGPNRRINIVERKKHHHPETKKSTPYTTIISLISIQIILLLMTIV